MNDEPRLLGTRTINITVNVDVIGHERPWKTGTLVTFAEHLSKIGGQGFRDIGITESDNRSRFVKLPFESIGIVNAHKIAIEEFANRIFVRAGNLDDIAHMWYLVAFSSEMLWVRCDWLKDANP